MPSSKAVVVCGVLTKGELFHCSIQADGDSVSHDSGRDGSLTTQLSEIITEGRADALEARAVRMACNVDGRSAKLHVGSHQHGSAPCQVNNCRTSFSFLSLQSIRQVLASVPRRVKLVELGGALGNKKKGAAKVDRRKTWGLRDSRGVGCSNTGALLTVYFFFVEELCGSQCVGSHQFDDSQHELVKCEKKKVCF